jgi:hypothetical protein
VFVLGDASVHGFLHLYAFKDIVASASVRLSWKCLRFADGGKP